MESNHILRTWALRPMRSYSIYVPIMHSLRHGSCVIDYYRHASKYQDWEIRKACSRGEEKPDPGNVPKPHTAVAHSSTIFLLPSKDLPQSWVPRERNVQHGLPGSHPLVATGCSVECEALGVPGPRCLTAPDGHHLIPWPHGGE